MKNIMRRIVFVAAACLMTGCVIDPNYVGVNLDVGIGGLLSYIGDVHIKASVGVERKGDTNEPDDNAARGDDSVWGYL